MLEKRDAVGGTTAKSGWLVLDAQPPADACARIEDTEGRRHCATWLG